MEVTCPHLSEEEEESAPEAEVGSADAENTMLQPISVGNLRQPDGEQEERKEGKLIAMGTPDATDVVSLHLRRPVLLHLVYEFPLMPCAPILCVRLHSSHTRVSFAAVQTYAPHPRPSRCVRDCACPRTRVLAMRRSACNSRAACWGTERESDRCNCPPLVPTTVE